MAVSIRMDPLLEKELALAAQRQGVSKSRFIIAAVERALGRKSPYELMTVLQAEEARDAQPAAAGQRERSYETVASKAALRGRLKARHEVASRG